MNPAQRKVKRRGFSRKRVSCFQEESPFNRIVFLIQMGISSPASSCWNQSFAGANGEHKMSGEIRKAIFWVWPHFLFVVRKLGQNQESRAAETEFWSWRHASVWPCHLPAGRSCATH